MWCKGSHEGLKIPWTVMSVPVRVRPSVQRKKVYFRTPSLDEITPFLLVIYERILSLISLRRLNKLKNSNVLVVGLGGVGSFAAEFLVRAGVGKMTIVDGDTVDITNINNGTMTETGFFDTYPSSNNASFNGVWNVYPYFESGNIIISDINTGFYIVRKSE